jgi:hypothetical protein
MTKVQIEKKLNKLIALKEHLKKEKENWNEVSSKIDEEYPEKCKVSLLKYIDSLNLPSIVKVSVELSAGWSNNYKNRLKFRYEATKDCYLDLTYFFDTTSCDPSTVIEGLADIKNWEEKANVLELMGSLYREFTRIHGRNIIESFYIKKDDPGKKPKSFDSNDELEDLERELRILNIGFNEGSKVRMNVSRLKSESDWRTVEVIKIYDDSTFKGIVEYPGHTETIRRIIDYDKMKFY